MLKLNRIFLFLAALAFLQVGLVSAQTQGKAVKWEGLNGKNNEFRIFMPEGYMTTLDDEYYLGKPSSGGARVEKHLKVARYINGVVLMMEYYQGKSKDIYEALTERESKTVAGQKETINGFQVGRFSVKSDKGFRRTDYYLLDKAVYVVRAYAKSEDDKLLKAFFESVRLVNQNTTVAPNASADAKSTALPNLIEQETVRLDDAAAIESKDADRPVITLKSERPRFSFESRQGLNDVHVKLKVLYSSSGKVTNVEVLEIPTRRLEREAIETAKRTVFIPAEKDGKLVSVYKIVEFSFGIQSR